MAGFGVSPIGADFSGGPGGGSSPGGAWGIPKYPFSSLLPPEAARKRGAEGSPLLKSAPMGCPQILLFPKRFWDSALERHYVSWRIFAKETGSLA